MTYTFGGICLDTDARMVTSSDGSVHLTRKAFDLIVLLLEHRPKAVSKEEIHTRLWPDTFVSESNLQTLVHEIRQAIDAPRSERSWIRTIHGVGYSFSGTVAMSHAPAEPARLPRPAAWLLGDSNRVLLRAGENIVGRGIDDGDNDVIEIDAPTISRRHARVAVGETATVEDLGSKNGTWLNGERVTAPRVLRDGDVVRLGSAMFTFRLASPRNSTDTADLGRAARDSTR